MKKKLFIICMIFVVFAVVLYYFCPNSNSSTLYEAKAALEDNGYQVEIKELEKHILRGDRYQLVLNGNQDFNVTVYVYETVQNAEADARTIDEDGFTIEKPGTFGMANTYCISWVDAPHFFLYKNVIVQYIGMDFDLLQCLYQLCGSQIAGQPFIDSPLID